MKQNEELFAGFIRGHAVRIIVDHDKPKKFDGMIAGRFFIVIHEVKIYKDIHFSPEFLDDIKQDSKKVIEWIDPYVVQSIEHFRKPAITEN